jgi:hypothetical protein
LARTSSVILPQRNRWFADSPLEGDGFEPSVPRQKDLCNTEIAADPSRGCRSVGTAADSRNANGRGSRRVAICRCAGRGGHCSSLPAITPR